MAGRAQESGVLKKQENTLYDAAALMATASCERVDYCLTSVSGEPPAARNPPANREPLEEMIPR
jgi:hypothetical protein